MSWVTVIWSMSAGISLSLAIVYFLVWVQERGGRVNLAFALWAFTTASAALIELAMMHARLPGHYGELVRWVHLPYGVMTVVYLWFISLYLQSGRLWLRLLIYGIVALRLVINFTTHPNFNFSEITALHYIPLWGELSAVPIGVKSPWQWIDEVSWLLVIMYSVDAIAGAWRNGRHRQSIVMGTCVIMTNVLTVWLASMTVRGTSTFPMTVSLPSLLIIMVIAHELSRNLIRAGKISDELSESQRRMSLAITAANLNPWEYDLARDEIWTNEKGVERMRAGGSAQLTAAGFFGSVHPDDREATRNAGLRAIEAGGEFMVEYRTLDTGGETRWIKAFGQVERDEHGMPLRVRGVSMDITERKNHERELEFIKKSIDVSPDGAYWMDVAGRFVYVNDVGCGSLGYSHDEMLRMSIFDVAPMASAEGWRAVWAFLRDKGTYVTETVHRRKDGSEFPVEISSTHVVIDGKEYVHGFARDITEKKLRNDALRESMERYRAIVEGFDGFIYICSQDHRIEFMNQRMIERTGHDSVGEHCYRALHDKDSVCEWCVNDRVFQGETVHWEIQSPKDQRWYYVVNTPIRHADGTISKQAMIQDITDRKKAEQESGQLRLELAHLNRVLTLSELSSSLAHEINQPLGSILNNASTAKIMHSCCAGGGGGEVAEILDDIIADANRAGQIVRKIRGIIKKESVAFELLDINTLIREVVRLFQNPLARERISMREVLSPDLLPVKGDRVRLQQVVMNLIMNATDAMKGSSSRILTIRTVMDGPDAVLVSVSDTGPGIDEKMKEKLFEPFYTTKKDGLGMGLRICRSILEDHGGSIRAENNAEGGAIFSFTLRTDGGGKG